MLNQNFIYKKDCCLSSLTIYTTGDFPYGMAPENLVRQMALGFKFHEIKVKVIRIRGKSFDSYNDTGIECSDLLFSTRVSNELIKFLELIGLLVAIPFSVIRNYFKLKPDAIILYGVEYFYFVFPFWIISKILKIKIIRIITDYYRVTTIVPDWWKQPKLFFYRLQFKIFDKYLNGIVSLSSYMFDFAIKSGVPKNRIKVIPHFIDVKDFCKDIVVTKKEEKIKIAFCGTINKSNGIYDLIEAFKLIYSERIDIELIIIGEPLKEDHEKIEQLLESFANSYIITGLLPKNEVSKALLSCDILVNPRQAGVFAEAGFPTKLGEYFATKLPVVSTNVGDIKNYFTDRKELVIVEPNRPDLLAAGILFLINDKIKSEEIGKNGYLWALSNLDYRQNAEKLLNFINSI